MTPRVRLQHLAALPITNGLGLSGQHDNRDWPRYIRTTDIGGPTSIRGDVFASQPPDIASSAMLEFGDVVACAAGTIGKSLLYLEREPACYAGFLVRFRANDSTDPRFVSYWMQSADYWAQVEQGAVKSTIENFSASRFRALLIPRPELAEQRRIADFLDDRVSRIDRIIAARSEQALRVWEAAKSHVSAIVSGTGPGWVSGDLRRFVTSENRVRVPLSAEERSGRQGRFPYYGASGVIDYIDDFLFDGPRVLLSEDGANLLLRRTPIAFVADGQYWVNNHAHILSPADGAFHFWAARIETLDVSPWVSGSAQPKLTSDSAMSLPVTAPVDVQERHGIGSEVAAVNLSARQQQADLERSIGLLNEYQTSLITAAVTGEIDVTTAGSNFPG